MFEIHKREVRFEEAAGESLKKPKEKSEGVELSKTVPVKSAAPPKKFTPAQINSAVNALTKFITGDRMRVQRISTIPEPRISEESFKILLT